jgi:manganese/zinc/iron transport system substrate-binding protein
MIAALLLSFLMLGCGDSDQKAASDISTRMINVIATTGMIGDLVTNIGGERVTVKTLMGPGIDPHLYKASERDVTRMGDADIIFYNGLHLEGAMVEVLEQMDRFKPTVAVAGEIEDDAILASATYEGMPDPHIWFDVALWMKAANLVAAELIKLDSAHANVYTANAQGYIAQLEELHAYVKAQAETVPEGQRVLITAHDAFNYFGKAYGFEVRGLQGISTASEAGTADVQNLTDFIVERKIPAMFVESSVPRRNIEAVQAAVTSKGFDVKIGGELFSDAMGSTGTPEGTYIGMVRHNIDTIVAALSSR